MNIIIPRHFFVDKAPTISCYLFLFRHMFLSDSLFYKQCRKIYSAHEIRVVRTSTPQIHFIKVNLIADNIELQIKHTDIVIRFHHLNNLRLNLSKLCKRSYFSCQSNAFFILCHIGFPDDCRNNNLLIQTDARQVNFIFNIEKLLY